MQSRKLGYFETLLYYAHQRGISQITFWVSLKGPITKKLITQALKAIFIKHPLLRSTIEEHDGSLQYEIWDDFNMIPIEFIEKKDDSHLKQIIYRESSKQLELNKQNWSAVILYPNSHFDKNYELILHFSHVVADGLSIINLIQEIISYIEQRIINNEIKVNSQPLYGSVEEYLKPLTLGDFLDSQKEICKECTPIELSELKFTSRSKLPYISLIIKNPLLETMIETAKSENISLNSLINATLLLAYWETTNQPMNLSFGSALNIRNKFDPAISMDICGNYFAPVATNYTTEDASIGLWPLAKKYHQRLSEVIARGNFLPTSFEFREMNVIVKDFMKPNSGKYSENIGSSYMGNIAFKTQNIEVVNLGLFIKDAGAINLISFIFNNELNLLFCYPLAYRTKSWVKELVYNFNEILSNHFNF